MKLPAAGLVLALAFACAPLAAATLSEAEVAAIQAKLAESQAAYQRGDQTTALRILGEAAMMDPSGEVAHKVGHMYEGMQDIPYREAEALKWFMVAAERRQADAMHHVGLRYLEGNGLKRDIAKGMELMEASADGGYHKAYEVAARVRSEQEKRATCLFSELRRYDLEETVFGPKRFYRVTAGHGESASGDTYSIEGLGRGFLGEFEAAALEVDGFSKASWVKSGDSGFFAAFYTPRPASAQGLQLAAQVRAACGVEK